MKKALLLLSAVGLLASETFAQSFRFGPELGVSITNSSHKFELPNGRTERADYSSRAGFKAGFVADIRMDRNLFFQPGIFYSQKGYKYSTLISDVDVKVDYLEIPMNVLFRGAVSNNVKFFAGGGPYVAFGVGGVSKYRPGRYYDVRFGKSRTDDFSQLDAGLNFNAGFEFYPGFFVRANYGLGIANVVPGGGNKSTQRMHGFSFTAGYLF